MELDHLSSLTGNPFSCAQASIASGEHTAEQELIPTRQSRPALLVVDDDEDTCLNLADIFIDLGYDVETACTGATAVEHAQKKSFNAFLLDLMMPGMDGLILFQRLHDVSPQTVAVLMTGEPYHPRAAECLQAGIRCVVSKPLDIPPLASLLAKIAS